MIRKHRKKFEEKQKGVLTFDHVSFKYPGADENVLEDITFTAKPGETTAIIGSTGSGKSTLVNLIPRFYDVTDGSIRLDGTDIREVTQHDLRDKLGYVPQKGLLFSGDIASNIMFGNPEGGGQEMKEAAQIAQATEFIEAKPNKYEVLFRRADRMCPEARNRDFQSQGRSQNDRKCLFLTTVFRRLTSRQTLLYGKL